MSISLFCDCDASCFTTFPVSPHSFPPGGPIPPPPPAPPHPSFLQAVAALHGHPLAAAVAALGGHHHPHHHLMSPVVAAAAAAASGKRKKSWTRAVFSNLQRKGLERRFQIQKYITKPDRRQLAATLGLTDAQVSRATMATRFSFASKFRPHAVRSNHSNAP